MKKKIITHYINIIKKKKKKKTKTKNLMLSNINQRYSFYHIYKQHFYAISLYCLNCVTKKEKKKKSYGYHNNIHQNKTNGPNFL